MTTTVLDSNNLAAVLADATGEAPPTTEKAGEKEKLLDPKDDPKAKAAPEADTDDDDDEEDEDGVTSAEKKELTAKMLKAVGKRVRKQREAEEFAGEQYRLAVAAKARADDLQKRLDSAGRPPQIEVLSTEPKRKDFQTEIAYVDALVKYRVDESIKTRDNQRAIEDKQRSLQGQLAKARELVPDFAEVTSKATVQFTRTVEEYVTESDMFAELGYYFAKNPKALERMHGLSPAKQLVEVARIEAKLSPFGTEEVKKASNDGKGDEPKAANSVPPSTVDTGFSPSKARSDAPVIRPLTGSEGTSVEPNPREMTTRQMIDSYAKAKHANLAMRKRH